ncbi:flavodoxin domain-containing protein, partial [Streptomyces sp. NPDC059474]|uniref:flavodoxin domain-containing protein n=1 Tax=Streptomyces sp. NPDC059474 TaxID=3346846 RepID=UPI00367B9097
MSDTSIVIASHSGYGHTAQIATAVADGARSIAGTHVHRVDVTSLSDTDWELMDAADAIIFGTPTYMGTA